MILNFQEPIPPKHIRSMLQYTRFLYTRSLSRTYPPRIRRECCTQSLHVYLPHSWLESDSRPPLEEMRARRSGFKPIVQTPFSFLYPILLFILSARSASLPRSNSRSCPASFYGDPTTFCRSSTHAWNSHRRCSIVSSSM